MIRAARYHAGIRVSVSVPMTFVLRKNHSASALKYLKSQFRGRMKVKKFTFDSSVKQKGFDFIRMETPKWTASKKGTAENTERAGQRELGVERLEKPKQNLFGKISSDSLAKKKLEEE
jgi:hypothetical protein